MPKFENYVRKGGELSAKLNARVKQLSQNSVRFESGLSTTCLGPAMLY